MTRLHRAIASSALAVTLALMLSGCGASGGSGEQAARPQSAGQRPAPNLHRGGAGAAAAAARNSAPTTAADAGPLQGRNAAALTRLFGPARIDMHEGPAHKLQFANDRCVLDAYLYPRREGAEPVVTHVDARALDGSDVDAAACAATLQQR